MKKSFLVALFAVSLMAASCVHSTPNGDGGASSYDGVSDNYPSDASDLAVYAADELAGQYPPVSTTLRLAKTRTPFGERFEAALRSKGFAVSTGQDSGIGVRYVLDIIQGQTPPSCYLQVRTSDGASLGKVRELVGMSFTNPEPAPSSVQSKNLPAEPMAEPAVTPKDLRAQPLAADSPAAPFSVDKATAVVAPDPNDAAPAPEDPSAVVVHKKSQAKRYAKYRKVSVEDFCRWNKVSPQTSLEPGRRVFIKAPAEKPKAVAAPAAAKALPASASSSSPSAASAPV
ncbi:MAG: hypothetical protein HQK82_15270, partial [Desulfovibrionaceae bacterium]|nr:hypothetical protein [Desulfovibrionaceae bacterium]